MDFQVLWQAVGEIFLHRRTCLMPLEFHQHVDKPGLDLSLGLFPTNRITLGGRIMAPQRHPPPNPQGNL